MEKFKTAGDAENWIKAHIPILTEKKNGKGKITPFSAAYAFEVVCQALGEALSKEAQTLWVPKNQPPQYHGAYTCFGTLHKGDAHEVRTTFDAYWNGDRWTDKDGEDLTYINESVEYWFDFSRVANPLT